MPLCPTAPPRPYNRHVPRPRQRFHIPRNVKPGRQGLGLPQRGITMAKPLGAKSKLIREAIAANPGLGNKDLADRLNSAEERKQDRLTFKADDVAQQKQAMKKPGP